MVDFANLPGGKMVEKGLRDAAARSTTVESLVVAIASTRLRRLGLDLPASNDSIPAELRLYRRLIADGVDDAYSRYNSLLRELTSFASALERESSR